jgi:hypothetical protein
MTQTITDSHDHAHTHADGTTHHHRHTHTYGAVGMHIVPRPEDDAVHANHEHPAPNTTELVARYERQPRRKRDR